MEEEEEEEGWLLRGSSDTRQGSSEGHHYAVCQRRELPDTHTGNGRRSGRQSDALSQGQGSGEALR